MKRLVSNFVLFSTIANASIDACIAPKVNDPFPEITENGIEIDSMVGEEILVCSELSFKDFGFWKSDLVKTKNFGTHRPFYHKEMAGADLAAELIEESGVKTR